MTLFSPPFRPPPPPPLPTDWDNSKGLVLGEVKVILGGEDTVGVVTGGLNERGEARLADGLKDELPPGGEELDTSSKD